MSCYVISKSDYEKVAGCIAAIGTQLDYYREQNFYRCEWNGTGYHLWDADDFRKDILKLYDLNVESVSKSWRKKLDIDDATYQKEFLQGYELALKLWRNRVDTIYDIANLEKLIYMINDFFKSVNYQLDDDECREKANKIMGYYQGQFVNLLKRIKVGYESLAWGEFDLSVLQSTK